MNEYIYFDRRFVQSILSQEMRGLTKSLTIQSEAYETSVRGSTTTPIIISGEVSSKVPLGPSVSARMGTQKGTSAKHRSEELTEGKITTEEIEMNDSIYESFEDIVISFEGFKAIDGKFRIFDLSNLLKIMQNSALADISSHELDRLPREARRSQEAKKHGEKIKKDYEFGLQVISLAKDILPSPSFLISEDGGRYFPIMENNLYLPSNVIPILYHKLKTRVLYKEIGSLSESLKANIPGGVFTKLYDSILIFNQFIYDEVGIQKDAKLCLPIAWYQVHDKN